MFFKINENYPQYEIEVVCQNQVIWKEQLYYEYYERFLKIGELLREKYGSRMIDLIPPENCYDLYGDKLSAPKLIKEFRDSLKIGVEE